MFIKGFEKIADIKKIIQGSAFTKGIMDKGPTGLPNRQRYALMGKAAIGKSGRKLTAELMKKEYGVTWKEPA